MSVVLGLEYQDMHTGLVGYAVAKTQHLSGASKVLVEAFNGEAIVEYWFDEVRLVLAPEDQKLGFVPPAPPTGKG